MSGLCRAGACHDAVTHCLVHVPCGWKPTILEVVVPRYRCRSCRRVWRHDIRAAAPSQGNCHATRSCRRSSQSWSTGCQSPGSRPILEWPGIPHTKQSWLPVTNLFIDSAGRLDGVTTPELATRCVTVFIDLTPTTRTRTGSSGLLAVVEGRSKQALTSWLRTQTTGFRDRVENCRDGRLGRLRNRHCRGTSPTWSR